MKVITAYALCIITCAVLALQSHDKPTLSSSVNNYSVTCIAEEQAPLENQTLKNAGGHFIGFQYYPENNRSTFATAGRLACYAMPVEK